MKSCKPFNNCFEFINVKKSIVTITDQKSNSKFLYKNQSSDRLSKYRVDNCLIILGLRCDYLLLNCDKRQSFFVELKGSDLISAVDQIDKTIDTLRDSLSGFSIHGRIVLTRVNTIDLINVKYLKLEKKIKNLKGDLRKQSREMTEVN